MRTLAFFKIINDDLSFVKEGEMPLSNQLDHVPELSRRMITRGLLLQTPAQGAGTRKVCERSQLKQRRSGILQGHFVRLSSKNSVHINKS